MLVEGEGGRKGGREGGTDERGGREREKEEGG